MIIKTKEFQESCKKILEAVDSTTKQALNETLELKVDSDKRLHLNVTNGEYYVSIRFKDVVEDNLHATIDAKKFLNLISKITTEYVELSTGTNFLYVKANGTYKFPFIYNSSNEMHTPKVINIEEVTSELHVNSDTLISIYTYNSKELIKGNITRVVQKLFYLDNEGCITFTTGACVNSFKLEKPIKLLLNQKIVRLFRLFEDGEDILMTYGINSSSTMRENKLKLSGENVTITAILTSDASLMSGIPVQAIRQSVNDLNYLYNVEISKNQLLDTLNRLLVFMSDVDFIKLSFNNDLLTVSTIDDSVKESISFKDSLAVNYSLLLNMRDFKATIESCIQDYLTLCFGNEKSLVVSRANIKNILPEGHQI